MTGEESMWQRMPLIFRSDKFCVYYDYPGKECLDRGLQMELCHKWVAARSAAILLLISMGSFSFLMASPVCAYNPQTDKDYLLPAQAKGGYISVPSSLESTRSAAKTSSMSS